MNTPAIIDLSAGSTFRLTVSDDTVGTNKADVRGYWIAGNTLIITGGECTYKATDSN